MNDVSLAGFSAISLNQLNAQASLMDRGEKKYLMHYQGLSELLESLQNDFAVLSIAGNSIFGYDNVYMDTLGLDFYHDHNQSKSDRIKVRTRHYREANHFYFECKQKNNGHMRKFRYAIEGEDHGIMSKTGYSFVEDVYSSLFGKRLKKFIFPSLKTNYQRITLCHKTKPEKITVDFALSVTNQRFEGSNNSCEMNNLVIIESKTNEPYSIGQKLIQNNGGIPVSTCTKYCFGHNLLNTVQENERFVDSLAIVKDIMESGKLLSKKTLVQKVQHQLD